MSMKEYPKSKNLDFRHTKDSLKEEENIAEYLLRVDEVVDAIRGLGGEIKERDVVDKVLRTMPMKYDSKVSTLE